MGTLLLRLKGSMLFNFTLFSPFLYIFEDLMMFRRRNWLVVREITLSYNQISRVDLTIGIFFSHLDLFTTSRDDVHIGFVNKRMASKAKNIIDRKIHQAHTKNKYEEQERNPELNKYERAMNRLKELYNKERITKREYDKKKKMLLDKFD